MSKPATKYRIVRDDSGPYAGKWVVEDQHGRVLSGPHDTRDDADHYVWYQERQGQRMEDMG